MTKTDPQPAFIPTTRQECDRLGWQRLDVILVTGDTYIDAPHIGVAMIGRVLIDAGYRVGIIAQPETHHDRDIARLGEPELFWGVTAGSVDSMVANFTAAGKRRRSDDMTPGGKNSRRPDRAVLVYSNLIRRYFKQTRPIVLGGIEASLRRISHYDAWSDAVRRSVLFDAKADYLLYGMAEQSVTALADALKHHGDVRHIRGLCYISTDPPPPDPAWPSPDVMLPAHQAVAADALLFASMFKLFYANADPLRAARLVQQQDTRFLVHNPPPLPLTVEALDRVYELPFSRSVHPLCQADGPVRAMETIQFSLTTHRGCFGECRFCAIAVHQGRAVVSRSPSSIMNEARAMTQHPDFKGIISDVGGPTANMYGAGCNRILTRGACRTKGCLHPAGCNQLAVDHAPQIALLSALRNLDGVRHVFVGSGVRYDLILQDRRSGRRYLETLLRHHVSGQLKIAPEHVSDAVLKLMGKPDRKILEEFLAIFTRVNRLQKKPLYLTYYFMAAHPGCTLADMQALRAYAGRKLRLIPEQVQIFTPTPSTFSTLMYHTGIDPFTDQPLFVEKTLRNRMSQKAVITGGRSSGFRKRKKR